MVTFLHSTYVQAFTYICMTHRFEDDSTCIFIGNAVFIDSFPSEIFFWPRQIVAPLFDMQVFYSTQYKLTLCWTVLRPGIVQGDRKKSLLKAAFPINVLDHIIE